jgi:hypothetical protein
MDKLSKRFRIVVAGALSVALSCFADAAPSLAQPSPDAPQFAAADCYAVGQRVAAQNGGTLARASAANQGGRAVCVIVVVVPARDGQRPRRMEVVVPAE